jgi:peptidoglycan/xylan/chitin deacetylase (PgdA/CDA1 family)
MLPRESLPRRLAKRAVAAALRTALRWSGRRAGVAILYHSVADRPAPPADDLVPAVRPSLFEEQLRHLRRGYEVVTASELPAAVARRRRGQRFPVALTFDDEHANHLPVVGAALARAGLRATFFLTGSSLSEPRRFWWERIQDAWDRDAFDDELLAGMPSRVAAAMRGRTIREVGDAMTEASPAERDEVAQALERRLGPDPGGSGMRAGDIRTLSDAGNEIGFHTYRHDYLPGLGDDALEAAMVEGRDELSAAAARELTVFAYPNGGHDERVVSAVRRAGFALAYTTQAVPVRADSNPWRLGRISCPADNVWQLALEIARLLARRG